MITNKNKARAMTKHIHVTVNANAVVQFIIQFKTGIINVKTIVHAKKYYSWNQSPCICQNSKYLKSVSDTSVTECDEIIIVMDNLSTKKTNTIAKNVTSIASINCCSKKVGDCYILRTISLVIMLLLIITIICYQYVTKKYNI